MPESLTHEYLKNKQREIREGFPDSMGLRVHRSISWIGRAENCEDNDGKFLFLWIAFNAAYSSADVLDGADTKARLSFEHYFEKLINLDTDQRIYKAIWESFSGPIRLLVENHYVFSPFWKHHNGEVGYDDWQDSFAKRKKDFARAFSRGDNVRILGHVFDRLYVLRNQLIHGGSTWGSSVNCDQVRDGASILSFLLPIFIDIMMDNPDIDWGRPFYPVVES